MNSSASAIVLYIFQLPAMNGVRLMSRASTPGSGLPSISSSDAPPPVERWSTRSASPNSASAAAESPPPTTVVACAVGDGLGYRAACRPRTARARTRPSARSRTRCRRRRSPRRRLRGAACRCRAPSSRRGRRRRRARGPRCRRRTRGPRRGRPAARSLSPPPSSACRAGSTPSSSHRESPTSWPWAREEREAHGAADQHRVGALQERVEDADLVGHLRAADDRHERALRVLEDAGERRDLALEQPPRRRRQQVRDRLGRGVRAVRGAERVVDVDVGERGVALRAAPGRSWSPPARSARSRMHHRRRRRGRRRGRARARRRSPSSSASRSAAGRSENSGSRSFGPPEVREQHELRGALLAQLRAAWAARRGCGRRR